MKISDEATTSRRMFLRFLAQSPLGAMIGLSVSCGGAASGPFVRGETLISSPQEAVNVFDFQRVAESTLPSAHYSYIATGVLGDETLTANRTGFRKFQLRVRRLIDIGRIDLTTDILGTQWKTPIVIAPVGSQRAFHPEGEVAVAKAARSREHLQILSTVTTTSVEDVNKARGIPVWYQLYPTSEWRNAEALLKRAEKAGCPVLVLTVDLQGGSSRETLMRSIPADPRDCSTCHGAPDDWVTYVQRKPMFNGLDVSDIKGLVMPNMTWEFINRIKDTVNMQVVVKGIVTREDAELCVKHGADGIIVSNHGGRAEESGRSTIECLPEVLEAVEGQLPVLIDSGFRRGTDIFKALALGATAVCIGRPYLWGLAAFGQEGVETVLDLLRAELEMVMRQAGTPSIDAIGPSQIVRG